MLSCIFACLGRIPWWAWLILSLAAVLLAILGWYTGGAWGAVAGALGPFAVTVLYCILGCRGSG
jgi:hypothetical protein